MKSNFVKRRLAPVLVLCVAMVSLSVFSTSVSAIQGARPLDNGGCSGSSCQGFASGGAGTHLTNTQGSGDLSGNNFVRFDAFAPTNPLAPQVCIPDQADRALLPSLNISKNFDGAFYLHRRVGVARSDNTTVVGGIEQATLFNQEWNADTGAVRNPKITGTKNVGDWFPVHWLGREYCLPLHGGNEVEANLSAAKPIITLNGKTAVPGVPFKLMTGMKNSTMSITVDSSRLDAAFKISFHLDYLWVIVMKQNADGTETYVESRNKSSSVYAKVTSFDTTTGVATYKIKFRKRGDYRILTVGSFTGRVQLPSGSVYEATGLTTVSDNVPINVISVRSVSRSRTN